MSWATVNGSQLEMNWVAHYSSVRVRDERVEEWAGARWYNACHYMAWSGYLQPGWMISDSLRMWLLWGNGGLNVVLCVFTCHVSLFPWPKLSLYECDSVDACMPLASSLPLIGFWCNESTKLRGFSMVYFMSRMVCVPPPSLHWPFLEAFAWSSNSQSLACSGLGTQKKRKKFNTRWIRKEHKLWTRDQINVLFTVFVVNTSWLYGLFSTWSFDFNE